MAKEKKKLFFFFGGGGNVNFKSPEYFCPCVRFLKYLNSFSAIFDSALENNYFGSQKIHDI